MQFTKCYECGGKTDLVRTADGPTITPEDALSKQRHFEFAEWCERNGRT